MVFTPLQPPFVHHNPSCDRMSCDAEKKACEKTVWLKKHSHGKAERHLDQGFPTGGTLTPKEYEIEHQGVRRSLGHRAAYISLIEQYISQFFWGVLRMLWPDKGVRAAKKVGNPWSRPGLPKLFCVAGHFHMRKFIVGHKHFCGVRISYCDATNPWILISFMR